MTDTLFCLECTHAALQKINALVSLLDSRCESLAPVAGHARADLEEINLNVMNIYDLIKHLDDDITQTIITAYKKTGN